MSYQTIKKLLVERLPKLRELTMGCRIHEFNSDKEVTFINDFEVKDDTQQDSVNYLDGEKVKTLNAWWLIKDHILGHDPSHSDLLKVLGESYALTGDFILMKVFNRQNDCDIDCAFCTIPGTVKVLQLPEDLKELDSPEWKDTSERLISLITK